MALELQKRPKRDMWYIMGTEFGECVRRSTGTADRKQAEAILAKVLAEILQRHPVEAQAMALAEATALAAGEIWKPIPGWEDCYEVSSLLRVRRKRHLRPLKLIRDSHGYLKVNLAGGGKQESRQIGHFYLSAFVGPRPGGMRCCHRDDNKTNNDPANLYWGTQLQNMQDKVRNGNQARGEKSGKAKLTEAAVRELRAARHDQIGEMATKFGISQRNARDIRARKTWKHVK
jgi:hypothetical protein